MPFYLVIILAPKVAFLNDKGEVIVRRTIPNAASEAQATSTKILATGSVKIKLVQILFGVCGLAQFDYCL